MAETGRYNSLPHASVWFDISGSPHEITAQPDGKYSGNAEKRRVRELYRFITAFGVGYYRMEYRNPACNP